MSAVLYINLWDSRCGECNKSADPMAISHDKVYGYNPGNGCLATWTHVSSDYSDFDGLYDTVKNMRPDLIFVDPMEVLQRGRNGI